MNCNVYSNLAHVLIITGHANEMTMDFFHMISEK